MGNLKPDTFARVLALATVKPQVFCELGTFEGKTAALATKSFREVHTVEASKFYYSRTQLMYQGSGIHFHYGDSRGVLQTLANQIKEPAVIYHDANWWKYPAVVDDFPLWDDLATMAKRDYPDIILVDEVHRFGDSGPTPHWKEVSLERIAACFPGHREAVVIDNLAVIFR